MTTNMTDRVTSLSIRWDDQPGVVPGWYVAAIDADGQCVADSMKIFFPVAVDDFGRDQQDELESALRAAFPGAEID